MSERTFLSIVIPAYNEEENISATLSEVSEYLGDKDLSYEVIMVDDGSTDATVSRANEFKKRLRGFTIIESRPNRGKGYVLRKGMLEAKGEYILFMDADSATSIKELDKFLPHIGRDFDIYIASRRIPGAEAETPLKRKLMGTVYIWLSGIVLGTRVSDLNCGFKIFRHGAAKELFSRQIMDDWSFDAEVLYLAGKYDCRIKEIPIEWVHKTTSKVRPLRDAVNSFVSLVKIRANDLKGTYR